MELPIYKGKKDHRLRVLLNYECEVYSSPKDGYFITAHLSKRVNDVISYVGGPSVTIQNYLVSSKPEIFWAIKTGKAELLCGPRSVFLQRCPLDASTTIDNVSPLR